MKTKLIITGIFLAASLFSCKNEEKKAIEAEEPKVETYDITVDLIIKDSEEMLLFYKDGSNQWFDEAHAVWLGVKGSDNVQSAVFSLPEGSLATDFRFDTGGNVFKNQQPIQIKKVTISYKGKRFEINEDSVLTYLTPNEFITFDKATKLYSFSKNAKGEFDPYFVANETLYPELAKVALGQ